MQESKFLYQGQEIDFVLTDKTDVMVNATEMAKAFGKETREFMKNKNTKEFIKVAQEFLAERWGIPHRSDDENAIIQAPNGVRIVENRGHMGIYFHRILALKFAAWLDPRFELWVYETIDSILFGPYIEWRNAEVEKITAQQQLEEKRLQLLERYPEFEEFCELEAQLKSKHYEARETLKTTKNQLFFEFFK